MDISLKRKFYYLIILNTLRYSILLNVFKSRRLQMRKPAYACVNWLGVRFLTNLHTHLEQFLGSVLSVLIVIQDVAPFASPIVEILICYRVKIENMSL